MIHDLKDKTVFITGGTGSFGQGFIKMLLDETDVYMVRNYSRDEHKQKELIEKFGRDRFSTYIGDIRDKDRLKRTLENVDWVVHAAALKTAPLSEIEGYEFVKTNINGTINVIEACIDLDIDRVLFISSDKAVEPLNLYGATKMVAEKLFIQANTLKGLHKTKFSFVRYGNVMPARGTIIPKFLALKSNEKVPITNINATRFWITLEDANKFVLSCLIDMTGGETYIPVLKSVRIVDVAKAVCPNKEIEIIGNRQGDKLHEVLSLEPRYSSDINDFLTIEEIRNYVYDKQPKTIRTVA